MSNIQIIQICMDERIDLNINAVTKGRRKKKIFEGGKGGGKVVSGKFHYLFFLTPDLNYVILLRIAPNPLPSLSSCIIL